MFVSALIALLVRAVGIWDILSATPFHFLLLALPPPVDAPNVACGLPPHAPSESLSPSSLEPAGLVLATLVENVIPPAYFPVTAPSVFNWTLFEQDRRRSLSEAPSAVSDRVYDGFLVKFRRPSPWHTSPADPITEPAQLARPPLRTAVIQLIVPGGICPHDVSDLVVDRSPTCASSGYYAAYKDMMERGGIWKTTGGDRAHVSPGNAVTDVVIPETRVVGDTVTDVAVPEPPVPIDVVVVEDAAAKGLFINFTTLTTLGTLHLHFYLAYRVLKSFIYGLRRACKAAVAALRARTCLETATGAPLNKKKRRSRKSSRRGPSAPLASETLVPPSTRYKAPRTRPSHNRYKAMVEVAVTCPEAILATVPNVTRKGHAGRLNALTLREILRGAGANQSWRPTESTGALSTRGSSSSWEFKSEADITRTSDSSNAETLFSSDADDTLLDGDTSSSSAKDFFIVAKSQTSPTVAAGTCLSTLPPPTFAVVVFGPVPPPLVNSPLGIRPTTVIRFGCRCYCVGAHRLFVSPAVTPWTLTVLHAHLAGCSSLVPAVQVSVDAPGFLEDAPLSGNPCSPTQSRALVKYHAPWSLLIVAKSSPFVLSSEAPLQVYGPAPPVVAEKPNLGGINVTTTLRFGNWVFCFGEPGLLICPVVISWTLVLLYEQIWASVSLAMVARLEDSAARLDKSLGLVGSLANNTRRATITASASVLALRYAKAYAVYEALEEDALFTCAVVTSLPSDDSMDRLSASSAQSSGWDLVFRTLAEEALFTYAAVASLPSDEYGVVSWLGAVSVRSSESDLALHTPLPPDDDDFAGG